MPMFNFMETAFPVMFFIVFAIIVGIIIFSVVKGGRQWSKNNNSPVLTVDAKVVTKRIDVSHHMHDNANGMHDMHTYTTHYVTFQVQSGDRMELKVPSGEYGMLVEGDAGKLTFQGTRYKGFERRNG